MFVKIFITIFFAVAAAAPVDDHHDATSYVTLSLGGHSAESQQPYLAVPQHQTSPIYIQKATPTIVKVPTITHKYEEEEHAPAHYEFKYAVEDKHTGDIKSQHEIREGDVVKGEYSLHEADGTIRTVKYSADKHNGFNAVVERTGHASHPEVKAVHTVPVVYDHYKH